MSTDNTSRISAGRNALVLMLALGFAAACQKDGGGAAPGVADSAEPAPAAAAQGAAPTAPVDLGWSSGDVAEYISRGVDADRDSVHQLAVTGSTGVVTGTSVPIATHMGVEILKAGGSAADAAITTALAEITAMGGSAISFAGWWTMVYYDAASGRTYSLNAGYNTVQEELDPESIPGTDFSGDGDPMATVTPSGRTAMVPGFMAGVQATHERFGKLPLADLFQPAIFLAEHGVTVDAYLDRVITTNQKTLSRLPETKAVFTDADGQFLKLGDTFRQPALAGTLRGVAEHGVPYMYTGPWAEKFVAMVRADGGKMTMKDMQDYAVIWAEPVKGEYKGYEIHSYGLPAFGGVHIIEAFNLIDAYGLPGKGHLYYESGDTLFWFSKLLSMQRLSYMSQADREKLYPGVDLSLESRLKPETSEWVLKQIEATHGDFFNPPAQLAAEDKGPKHSAGIVAVDQWGNVAAVVHSINTDAFGYTGIFVDGVSIPDSAWFQRRLMKIVGPGKRLPSPTNPTIVMKDGKPYLGSAAIGAALHRQTMQGIYNVLEYGKSPNDAASTPSFIDFAESDAGIGVTEDEFSQEVLDEYKAAGGEYTIVPGRQRFWVSVLIDPATGALSTSDGMATKADGSEAPQGLAEGY